MLRDYFLIFILSFYSFFSFNQGLKYIEKTTIIKYKVPDDKALLIFQTDLDLTFKASNDLLKSIVKEDGKYKILISSGSQLVTIISEFCGRIMLNFVHNELGVLNPKEIRYFIIEKANIIGGIDDITNEEIAKGASDLPGYNKKDGFLFFYTSSIPNIEFQFIEKNGYITKVVREFDRYQLYAKSGVPLELKIITKGYDDIICPIFTLDIKGVKYFRLYPLNNVGKIKDSDTSIKKGSYKIITSPKGALLEIDGYPLFNRQPEKERKTPKQLDSIKAGRWKIYITLENYEKVSDEIIIGGKQNKSEYKLIPKYKLVTFYSTNFPIEGFINSNRYSFYISDKPVRLPYGRYSVKYSKSGYFDKNKIIKVNDNYKKYKVNLFKSPFLLVGGSYGLQMLYINLGFCSSKLNHLVGNIGVVINTKKHKFNYPVDSRNADVYDILSYDKVGTINYDNKRPLGFNLKLGWFFQKPFNYILNVGYNGIYSRKYQYVYQAKHDYISISGNSVISKDEYFTSSKILKDGYKALSFGFIILIKKRIYFGADYLTNSEIGKGLVYSIGLVF